MATRRVRMRRHKHGALMVFLRLVAVGIVAVLILGAGATAFGYAMVQSWLKDLPDANSTRVAEATKVYSSDGVLLARLYLENREVVPLTQISPWMRGAVIAVEDERFYQHQGYDIPGIVRAAVKDVTAGGVEEGASTLTQQYIRQTLLSREATQVTIARKIREIYLAQELEKRHPGRKGKDEILAMYLNTVYFGDGAYGAEAASKDIFAKHAKDLSLAQAALIAGLPQSPRRLNPMDKDNVKRAIERQHWVLAKMLEQKMITPVQYQKAVAEKLWFKRMDQPGGSDGDKSPYFVAYVKKLLQDKFSTAAVFKGGLRVYTTIDTRMQKSAEEACAKNLNEPGDPACALVSIDPKTGYIKAMVGGKDYTKSKFNLATQGKRQPGSSFKTFVLVTALEKGIPPYRAFDSGAPVTIDPGGGAPPWVVYNSEGHGGGYITLEKATEDSVNAVYARLIEEVGAGEVANTAKKMGITSHIPPMLSIALGSQVVTPLEMASAYGTLADNGVHYEARAITKVVGPNGQVLWDLKPEGKQVISREIAYAATKILEKVITGGTGTAAEIGRPAAGKTGTSQNYRDAWFVGYTPQLVTSVWVGYTTERSMTDVHGQRGFGGTLAAPIWHDYMSEVLDGKPEADFAEADKPDYIWKDSWERARRPKPVPASNPASGGANSGGGNGGGGGGGNNGGNNGGGNGGGNNGGGNGGGTKPPVTPPTPPTPPSNPTTP